jgi:hypothetical protein
MLRLLFLLIFLSFTSLCRADWVAESDLNAMDLLEQRAAFSPETASEIGLAEFDADITDLNAGLYERRKESDLSILQEMRKRESKEKNPKIAQDLAIIVSAIEKNLQRAEIRHAHLLPYYNLHQALFYGFSGLLDPQTDAQRYPAALQRLRKYTGQAMGHQPLTELAQQRTQERFTEASLVGPYRQELEADMDNASRYISGIRDLFIEAGLEGWQEDFALLEKQLTDYHLWMREELMPRARADSRLPAAVYANNLKYQGVNATPEQLISMGQYSYQLIRSEMKALAVQIARQRGWKDWDLVSVLRALKQEQIPPDEVLAVYRQRLLDVEEIIRREQLITLPRRDAAIRLATEAESSAIPAPFMNSPQLVNNTGQFGEFVIVQSNPSMEADNRLDDFSHYAISWHLTAHEARPGHELQFTAMVENGVSLAKAEFAFNNANVEGWGLYAESIMQEFLPLEGQLFNLWGRQMRAARMFMDPMINTGLMTHAQAVAFMIEQIVLSPALAKSEADRYSFRAPGQATSYYFGYISLLNLRTEIEIRMGDQFNQQQFHDFILEQGLLPANLLRQAALQHFHPAKQS